jgi:hypothetical protein
MAEQPSATPPEMSAEPTPSQGPDPIAIRAPLETEDVPPTFSNIFYVEGSREALAVSFFYLAPTKISRILASPNPEQHGQRVDGVIRISSEPLARVAISMSNASALVLELYRAILFSAPSLRDELVKKLHDGLQDLDRTVGSQPSNSSGVVEEGDAT